MTSSIVLYSCGCSSILDIPTHVNTFQITLEEPGGSERYDLPLTRVCAMPPVFFEAKSERPEWAAWCHSMIWFDPKAFDGCRWEKFDHLFEPYRRSFGPLVPSCWISDIMTGRGRFFGLWKEKADLAGHPVNHLRVVDLPTTEVSAEIGTVDA